MRTVTCAVIVALATVTARAQTTTAVLPLPASWGAIEIERFIETDGDPATVEVLIWRYTDYLWRVVAVQPDGMLCAGRWFAFNKNLFAWPRITRVGAVDVAFLTDTTYQPVPQSSFFQVALEHPTVCLP